jgi:hemerythrin-like domain-containing protein
MSTDTGEPADTRIMGIVHQALRRDLGRTRTALTAAEPPASETREAIARHVGWMMQFLHLHHAAEDEGLYPLVRARRPDAAALLDQMHADHQRIQPAIAEVETTAVAYCAGDDDGERGRLIAALDDLEASLLPHLLTEEQEMMPVVSATLTDAEWRRWDQEHNLEPKSFGELGFEGHWLIDDLGSRDRDVVIHLVAPLPRLILLKGFAGSYRRRAAACWSPPLLERRVGKHGHVDVVVDTDRDAIWALLCDVTRVGEWSHECIEAGWLGNATSAVPGARFRGKNRAGMLRWGRVSEIVESSPWTLAWRTVPSLLYPDSTEWRVRLEDTRGGTRIEQTFQVLHIPRLLDMVYARLIPAHRDRATAITEDLRRLATVAATTERPATRGRAAWQGLRMSKCV